MRTNLKVFRVKLNLTQDEISEKLSCNRQTYSSIENGSREGRHAFWQNLQTVFDIPDEEMWALMKNA